MALECSTGSFNLTQTIDLTCISAMWQEIYCKDVLFELVSCRTNFLYFNDSTHFKDPKFRACICAIRFSITASSTSSKETEVHFLPNQFKMIIFHRKL